MMKHSTW